MRAIYQLFLQMCLLVTVCGSYSVPVLAYRIRIGIDQDGLYQVTGQDLVEVGMVIQQIQPHLISMTNRGEPVPISIRGESDGRLDLKDQIIFFGRRNSGPNTYYDFFTDENVYWLSFR